VVSEVRYARSGDVNIAYRASVTISVDGGAASSGAYMVEKYRRRKAASDEGK
jgi:hypothetical protein